MNNLKKTMQQAVQNQQIMVLDSPVLNDFEKIELAFDILEQARVITFNYEEVVIAIDATLWKEFIE